MKTVASSKFITRVVSQQTRFKLAPNETKDDFREELFHLLTSQTLMNAGQVYYITSMKKNTSSEKTVSVFKALLVLPNLNIPEIVFLF